MKQTGIHWAIRAQIARRGGFQGGKVMATTGEIGEFIQSLREADAQTTKDKVEDNRTGGYAPESMHSDIPPGLEISNTPPLTGWNGYSVAAEGTSLQVTPDTAHDGISTEMLDFPADIAFFDFTLPEGNLRSMIFGRDDWVIPPHESQQPIPSKGETERDHSLIDSLVRPYIDAINPDLHCALLNWLGRRIQDDQGNFEALLAEGIRNLMAYGDSHLRRLSSDSLLKLKCMGRFHVGAAGVCRIVWGPIIGLGDCPSQELAIGNLHFQAIDYGDIISLNETMRQRVCAIEKDERNQCTLLALAAGLVARDLQVKDLPARSRVAREAHELRIQEWLVAQPLFADTGHALSMNERTIMSLFHDITHPNHDRDYRSLCIFWPHY